MIAPLSWVDEWGAYRDGPRLSPTSFVDPRVELPALSGMTCDLGGRTPSKNAALLVTSALCLVPKTAAAASLTIPGGTPYQMSQDITLNGADSLDAAGTDQSPCSIVGNGHRIVGKGLTGHVKITNCVLSGLGGTDEPHAALDLEAVATGDVTIQGSTFDASGAIQLHLQAMATATFKDNLIKDNNIVYIEDELVGSHYVAVFLADGGSKAPKLFQGNSIYRSGPAFEGTDNWLIGGYDDSLTNILYGHRVALRVRGTHMKIVGNYVFPQYPLTSPDVENTSISQTPDAIIEHNVFRNGEWNLRGMNGDFRYNLVVEMNGHSFIKGPVTSNIHHNLFVDYKDADRNREAGIDLVYLADHINIYNNTFDGSGAVANFQVPIIHAKKGRVAERVHSNAIVNFLLDYPAISATCPDTFDDMPPPGDPRMLYADYNLFYNPGSKVIDNYSLSVEPGLDTAACANGCANPTKLVERKDDGFAKHDIPVGGNVDDQADPKLTGPLPTAFPFDNADIVKRVVKVSDILKRYRALYTPAAGSPLIDSGDPQGGPGNDIGAIGAGTANVDDKFGTLQPGVGGGPPPLPGSDAGSVMAGAGGSMGASNEGGPGSGTGTGTGTGTGAGGATNPGAGGASPGSVDTSSMSASESGCGCVVPGSRGRSSGIGLFAILAALAAVRIRRRA